MFEYIFFESALRDKFISHAEQRGVPCTCSEDHLGLVVEIPEDLPDAVADEMEAYYEMLEDEQQDLSKNEGELQRLAGFRFNLPNGEARMLPLSPEMANRLMKNFTLGEIQALFESMANCTLQPNEEHLCKILAAQKHQ